MLFVLIIFCLYKSKSIFCVARKAFVIVYPERFIILDHVSYGSMHVSEFSLGIFRKILEKNWASAGSSSGLSASPQLPSSPAALPSDSSSEATSSSRRGWPVSSIRQSGRWLGVTASCTIWATTTSPGPALCTLRAASVRSPARQWRGRESKGPSIALTRRAAIRTDPTPLTTSRMPPSEPSSSGSDGAASILDSQGTIVLAVGN